ncbi:hypothetical protein J1614_004839 [Plenodomus biglobosus]|nr:hypothetical protein J1614_004839 [Plenodomus biglobosus]
MNLMMLPILALCALLCSAAGRPSKSRSTSYSGYAVLPIWTEDYGMNYLVNITIGDDNQTVPLIFDTGSPDTFLNIDCFTLVDNDAFNKCLDRPRYNAFTSTSSDFAGGSFSLSFSAGESHVSGTYVDDDMHIGSAAIKAKHIGLAATSRNFETGLFGAGRSAVGDAPSIIEQMVAQGEISNYAFSLDLGPLNSPEPGTVIFGGIDTKRYMGNLTMLEGTGFRTYLTGLGFTFPNGTHIDYDISPHPSNNSINPDTPNGLPVFLDTGSPYNLVPETLLDNIIHSYPAVGSSWGLAECVAWG